MLLVVKKHPTPFHPSHRCLSLLALLSLFTLTTPLPASTEDAPSPSRDLSHAYLFAPNKTFPYFESCGKLEANTPTHFSPNNAAMLAQCCMLIYVKEPEFIKETLQNAGFQDSEFFDIAGTYAFLAESPKHIVIAFRGTETGDLTDYLTDAKIHQRPFTEHGRAHSGFLDALAQVQEQIQKSLAARLEASPEKMVWVTGHSLGGALATLFSIQNADSIDALYTIGSPRAANRKLAAHWHELLPIFRIVNNNDLVARIPAPPLYQHIGPTYFLTADGDLIVDPPQTRLWKERLKGHGQFIEELVSEHWAENDFSAIPSDYFVDHSQLLYVETLIALAASSENVPQ